jgi:5-oxoprolinase (ATP-hydrolysing)
VYRPLSEALLSNLEDEFAKLEAVARRDVKAEGIPPERIEVRRLLDLRYQGLDSYLTLSKPANGDYAEAYIAEHERLYGYAQPNRAIEVVAVRVEVTGLAEAFTLRELEEGCRELPPERTVPAWFNKVEWLTPLFERERLVRGQELCGPAIISEARATTVIEPGWRARLLARGELLIEDLSPAASVAAVSTEVDPIELELFNNRFGAIAEQMGITLRQTASSVNVKERLDFSCALFTGRGDLVVNAPHIPVHLGAMSETVKAILVDNPDLKPGDVFLTNDPYRGGSHLPDLTVVTPVHDPADGALLFFTASRAHHAELGGIRPGSMPPFSKTLAEEGVLIRNFKLVEAGRSCFEQLRKLLLNPPWPTRGVEENLADLRAQVAANRQGAHDLLELLRQRGRPVVLAYMGHIQDAADRKMRRALLRLADGFYRFVDHLDDGTPIAVGITIRGEEAEFDFAGSGAVHPGNLNANRAIVTAAVLYVLRCLIDEEIPLNAGVLAPVRLHLPEGVLNPPADPDPARCAAVVGGNVETSQRIVDVLLGALRLAAASQGTMNNVLFGDERFGYYETICGGAGATAESNGADAVHTHMTNTRLTDPEVLEHRLPLRVKEFSIRRGSGGAGRHRGGDGTVRRLEFLAPLELSIVSQRRGPASPFGLDGGNPGRPGENELLRRDGSVETLSALAQTRVEPGELLTIRTPGGGGYGVADGGPSDSPSR